MIHFHVLDNQIVGCSSVQLRIDVFHPFTAKGSINAVHHGNLIVQKNVTVVGHAAGDRILAFKEIKIDIVDTDITDCIGIHDIPPSEIVVRNAFRASGRGKEHGTQGIIHNSLQEANALSVQAKDV